MYILLGFIKSIFRLNIYVLEPGKENTRTENKNRFCSSLNIFSLRVFLLFIEHFQTRMFQHIVEISNKQIVSSFSLNVFIYFSMTNASEI